MMPSTGLRTIALAAAAALSAGVTPARAHDGPPYPIATDAVAGPYRISIWADPDTTDAGPPAGQFWVVIEPVARGITLPPDTSTSLSIAPLDRAGPTRTGRAAPVSNQAGRQFVALLMDHEGRFSVRAEIAGPLGAAMVETEVEATYDLRPPPVMVAVYVMAFLLAGGLWVKLLLARRRIRGIGPRRSRNQRAAADTADPVAGETVE